MNKQQILEKLNGAVINAETRDVAKKLCDIFHDRGFRWLTCNSYENKTHWTTYQGETCYNIENGSYGTKGCFAGKGKKIIPSIEFLSWFEPQTETLPNYGTRQEGNIKIIAERLGRAQNDLKCSVGFFSGGKITIEKTMLDKDEALELAEFINKMYGE